jgi:hypothetical protein
MVANDGDAFTLADRASFRILPTLQRDARQNGHLVAWVHGSDGLPRAALLAGPGGRVGSPDRAGLLESSVGQSEVEMAGGLSL